MGHLPTPENEGAAAIAGSPAISSGHGIPFREAVGVWAKIAALSFGGPAGQIAVMHRILVEEKRWTDVELTAFEQAWNEVPAEQLAADPTFKQVADNYLAFRKVYKA